jgi:enoyl-[acyl-carrier protein] reductase III
MIETEKTRINGGMECDGQCDVRLLRALQKAIADILSDHAPTRAANSRQSIETPAQGEEYKSAQEHNTMTTNGYGLQSESEAGSISGFSPQDNANPGVIAPSRADTAKIVIDTIAEITRYPREILTPQARFDEDLGIDSLKRAEIVTALLNQFGEAPGDLKALGPTPLTVGELTEVAVAYVSKLEGTVAKPQPAGNDMDARAAGLYPSALTDGVAAKPATGVNAVPVALPPGAVSGRKEAADRLFEGKVALVTDSGHGLGQVIAKQMAALGAHVIINSFHSRDRGKQAGEEIPAEHGQATQLWGSVVTTDHIDRAFHQIEQRFDRLDYYIHNAADGVLTSLEKATESHWEKAFRTDIIGYHLCAMRAAKLMQKSGGGRIVALSSSGAKRYIEYYGVMGPVKAALESLTMYLAQELAPCNVQVNAVAACPIYGERLSSFPDSDRLVRYWESRMPGARLANQEEISEAVIFLLSTAASKINGSTMVVDGGWSQRI